MFFRYRIEKVKGLIKIVGCVGRVDRGCLTIFRRSYRLNYGRR